MDLQKRAKILTRLANLLDKRVTVLGKLITQEMGKTLGEARSEVENASKTLKYFIKEGLRVLSDEVIDPELPLNKINKMTRLGVSDAVTYLSRKNIEKVSVIRYDPVGVVGVIKPWNYPVNLPLWAIGPALLAGNAVVYKPSENVPLVSNELAKLIWQAGVPKEVFQIIHGRAQAGAMLVDSDLDKVSFTGSTEVGKEIAEKCASRFIKYSLELGGSSPAIILKDADLNLAVEEVVKGRFSNCGQVCKAIKRVFVHKSIADKFIQELIKVVAELKMGDPMDKETCLGPLVSLKQLRTLQDQVAKGVVQGGRILEGGRRMRDDEHKNGFFHEPTIMTYVRPNMSIMQEEVFGPVLPICVVENEKQAIKYANQSNYGLTAAVFTKSKIKARQAIKDLEAGSVYVNKANVSYVNSPLAPMKHSGVGVERSRHGIWRFVNIKHLHLEK